MRELDLDTGEAHEPDGLAVLLVLIGTAFAAFAAGLFVATATGSTVPAVAGLVLAGALGIAAANTSKEDTRS